MKSLVTLILVTAAQAQAAEVNFNQLIDSASQERSEIKQNMNQYYDETQDRVDAKTEQKRVMDFVDMEIGWKAEAPTVVDRRFDSVGDPIVDSSFAKKQLN